MKNAFYLALVLVFSLGNSACHATLAGGSSEKSSDETVTVEGKEEPAKQVKKNEYEITFLNETSFPYLIAMKGADPIVLKKGEKKVRLEEAGEILLGTPSGVKRIVTTQLYPLPSVMLPKEVEGSFSPMAEMSVNGDQVEVTFTGDEPQKTTITLKNLSKSPFPPSP